MNNRALYLITVLIWGTTWIAIEFQLGTVSPGVSIFYRYFLASLLLFGWCRARRLPLAFGRGAHLHFALLGLLLFGLNYILTYHAQFHITSALAAIAFSTMLWMNIVNSRLFFGTRAGARVLLGSALGIAGIVTLFLPEVSALSLSDSVLYGAGLCVAGAYVSSLGNMVSQSAQKQALPILQSNAWAMLYGAVFTGLLAVVQGNEFNFDWSVGYVASLLYLAVFGSIVAFGSYLTLLGRIGASRAGYAVVMFPVVALAVSFAFEGLALTLNIVLGVVLVMAGNVIILRRNRATPEECPGPVRDYRSRAVPGSP
ncbi:MAG TPA: EamA family transporter [Woeseiaceae bacterium]|nr:EamA family transporter [Woeseiaceae bacterium]